MKRFALAALTLLVATAALAEPQRYLVATKRAFHKGGFTAATTAAKAGIDPSRVSEIGLVDAFAATLTEEEVRALEASSDVRYVEKVVGRHALDTRVIGAQTTPYGVSLIQAPLAWAARSFAEVNVVVIDTGVDYRHPELAYVWAGGWNFIDNNADPLDDNGHGTHVSGTIVAKNDSQGVVGVAPGVRLWGLKVLNAAGNGNTETLIHAVDWVVAKKRALGGRWVLNLSLGSKETSTLEEEAFQAAADEGLLIVAASGNASTAALPAPVMYPAAYTSVIAVGAVDSTRKIANFSCQGPELDLTAPGVSVLSSVRIGSDVISYYVDGTAAAKPVFHVEGSKLGQVTGQYVYCDLGKEGEISSAKVAGKIALIKRGEIKFAEKAKRAHQAGAIAVAIFNHEDSSTRWTLLDPEDPTTYTYAWPLVIALKQEEGEALLAKKNGTVTLAYTTDDYGEKSGTSMASPHVAGAAALLWSLAPNASRDAVINAMTAKAIDLGPTGPDPAYGVGFIDVNAAARMLAPSAFDEPEPLPGRPTTGRRVLSRGRGQG